MSSSENKEYSVNWKNHMSHVRKAFDNLLSTNELTDVTLYCEGKKIGAHKMLLSACSTYFRDTFKEVPCQHPVIILYGVEYSVLSDILQFIYRGEVSVDTAKLDSFLKTAQLLQISGLTDDPSDRLVVENDQSENDQSTEVSRSEQAPEEDYTETIQSTSTSEDTKRGTKRLKLKETDAPREKIHRPAESDTLFVSDVKCEPSELVNFEDPLEDPLLQSDQSSDTREFFGTGTQGDEEFKTETANLLPEKSKAQYEQCYQLFCEWCERKNVQNITEDLVFEYFQEKSKAQKPSSLWTLYSMLKATLILNNGIDISKHHRLSSFLKQATKGYQAQKSRTLTREQLHSFLREADDEKYLMIKVAVIFGISGSCRRNELTNMLIDHIEDKGTYLVVIIPDTDGKIQRVFTVTEGDLEGVNFLHIYRKYASLRPLNVNHNRFFLFYRNGKCSTQVVGINTFGKFPRLVAEYLGLPNSAEYTGRCFRSSSASLSLGAKAVITPIHGATYSR